MDGRSGGLEVRGAGSAAPCALTLAEASRAIASGELKAIELAASVLARIEETEPRVHAYECVLHDELRAAAARADEELERGTSRGPLHGVPLAIKDLLDVAGTPTTASSDVRRDIVADDDAEVVTRLRDAGALLCGKTVTHEFAFGVESPPTRSPWDSDRIPGGSSGGSGAAVAVDSCIAAIGTDTGCSIRLPAGLCGIAGLKPTYGRVSNRGMVPLAWSLDHIGPMAKTVEDCAILLGVIAGQDRDDPASVSEQVPDWLGALDGGAAGLRIGVPRNWFFDGCDEGVERLVREGLATLEREGAELVEVEVPNIELGLLVAFVITLAETSSYHRPWIQERRDRYGAQVWAQIEAGSLVLGSQYVDGQRARTVLVESMRRAFVDNRIDVLAAPTAPTTAPPAGQRMISLGSSKPQPVVLALARNLAPIDVTGQPAISIPCGFFEGQPVGMQLIGRPFDEATVLRIARAFEAATSWHLEDPPEDHGQWPRGIRGAD